MLITIAAATTTPVTSDEAIEQLNLDEAADDAQLATVGRLIKAATGLVEGEAAITLQPTDFEQRLDCWPCGPLALETGPVRDVTEISYIDANGAEQTLPEDEWDWEPTSAGAVIWLLPGFSSPTLQPNRPGGVRIAFSAGFNDPTATEGDDRLKLPDTAGLAVLMLVGHWFRNREAEGVSTAAADRLINRIRVFR